MGEINGCVVSVVLVSSWKAKRALEFEGLFFFLDENEQGNRREPDFFLEKECFWKQDSDSYRFWYLLEGLENADILKWKA